MISNEETDNQKITIKKHKIINGYPATAGMANLTV
jgi:hypothetical protein